ncbi:hypothetical protein [Kineosporia babensis]|uniref:Uncharacterized protein n=1 Tax=Kineosporia babensis TaxID=499548 RepID=A0A9X1NFL1_9ACTN|nr:hypothetical protein [Kineosporia babensis]MCD5312411.1 hypothetical protein [Kineosporia babensis]
MDHERPIARIALANEALLIRVAQRIAFILLADPIEQLPYPPRITLGDYEIDDVRVREITGRLVEAADFVETLGFSRRPRLVLRG